MGLDGAVEDLELDIPVGVEGDDPGNAGIRILVADNAVPTDDDVEAGADVWGPGPQGQLLLSCFVG